jgi:hypothetical protein
MQGPLLGVRGAPRHKGRTAGDTGAPQRALPRGRGRRRQGHRLVAERLVERILAGKHGREQEEGDAVLPGGVAALLRRGQVRSRAGVDVRRQGRQIPTPGFALCEEPDHPPSAPVCRHFEEDVGHQSSGVPRFHLQKGNGCQRFSQVRANADRRPQSGWRA